MRSDAILVCDLCDTKARARFWTLLRQRGAVEVEDRHWADIGVEHWTFRIGREEVTVCEDYGELVVHGPPELLRQLQSSSGID